MVTRVNPLAGRYFNDPNIAAAISGLAGAFAPPAPEELMLAEQMRGERMGNDARERMFGLAGDNFDQLGIVADLYDPSNSYYSVNTAADTARRGQDIAASTELEKARMGGLFDLAGTTLSYDQAMPGLSPDIAAAIGVPAMPPQSGAALGAPAPLPSETQVLGMERMALRDSGQLTDQMILDAILSDMNTEKVMTPEGPRIVSRADAMGMEPFVDKGSEAAAKPVVFVDPNTGEQRNGSVKDGAFTFSDGTPVPPGWVAGQLPSPTGGMQDLFTNSNATELTRIRAIVNESNSLISALEGLIQQNAGAAGLPGTVQMLGQDLLTVGRELGSAFGDDPNAIITQDMLPAVLGNGEGYDPVFREIRAGMLQLAYLNARRDNPSGEVSRFALERQIEALSQGLLANDESVLAALGMSRQANDRKLQAYEDAAAQAVGAPAPTGAAPAPGTPNADGWVDVDGVLIRRKE